MTQNVPDSNFCFSYFGIKGVNISNWQICKTFCLSDTPFSTRAKSRPVDK